MVRTGQDWSPPDGLKRERAEWIRFQSSYSSLYYLFIIYQNIKIKCTVLNDNLATQGQTRTDFLGISENIFLQFVLLKKKKYALKVENRSVKRSLLCILENLFQVSFETETNYGSASIRDDACVNILLLPFLDSEYRFLTHSQRYSRLGGDCMQKVFCTCKMFPLTKAQWKISSFLTFSALDLLIKPLILLLQ